MQEGFETLGHSKDTKTFLNPTYTKSLKLNVRVSLLSSSRWLYVLSRNEIRLSLPGHIYHYYCYCPGRKTLYTKTLGSHDGYNCGESVSGQMKSWNENPETRVLKRESWNKSPETRVLKRESWNKRPETKRESSLIFHPNLVPLQPFFLSCEVLTERYVKDSCRFKSKDQWIKSLVRITGC